MDFNLHQLRMLREVAHRGTMAAAAESLGYTASAVSQQLANLERSVGVGVLEKVGRNVRLTDAGRELVAHAGQLLDGAERAQAALELIQNEPRGRLDMTVFESVAGTLLPEVLGYLRERCPDLVLHTRQGDPDAAPEDLLAGSLDLALVLDYPHAAGRHTAGVARYVLFTDIFRLVVPADDELHGTVALASVRERPFIASPGHMSCGRCVIQACRAAGFEPDIHHELDDYPSALGLVAGGAGVALIPDLALRHLPSGVRVLDLEASVTRRVELAVRESSSARPAIVAVRTAFEDAARAFNLQL